MSNGAEYKLYAAKPRQPVPSDCEYSFIPQSMRYLLVYTSHRPDGAFMEIDFDEVELPRDIQAWVLACQMDITANALRATAHTAQESAEAMERFIKSFGDELEKARTTIGSGTSRDDRE